MPTKVFVSPGVYTSEKDLTFITRQVGVTTLGLVGETTIGPAFQPIFVSNYGEFQSFFGGQNPTKIKDTGAPKYELPYIAKGKYVFGINDDTLIATKDWNRILEDKLKEFKIYYPKTKWAPEPNGYVHDYQEAFPIFPKKIVNIWGYLCPHNNIDTWFTTICDKIQLDPWNISFKEYLNDVTINHIPLDDQLYKDKLETVHDNHSLRDYHTNSAELYHCINLLVEHVKYLEYKNYKEMNIINNYKNNMQN